MKYTCLFLLVLLSSPSAIQPVSARKTYPPQELTMLKGSPVSHVEVFCDISRHPGSGVAKYGNINMVKLTRYREGSLMESEATFYISKLRQIKTYDLQQEDPARIIAAWTGNDTFHEVFTVGDGDGRKRYIMFFFLGTDDLKTIVEYEYDTEGNPAYINISLPEYRRGDNRYAYNGEGVLTGIMQQGYGAGADMDYIYGRHGQLLQVSCREPAGNRVTQNTYYRNNGRILQQVTYPDDGLPQFTEHTYCGTLKNYRMVVTAGKNSPIKFRTVIKCRKGRMVSNSLKTEYGKYLNRFTYNEQGDLWKTTDQTDGSVLELFYDYDKTGNWIRRITWNSGPEPASGMATIRSIKYSTVTQE